MAILALGISGIVLMQQSGAPDIIFGDGAAPLPDLWQYTPRYNHAVIGKALFVLVVIHVLGALYHRLIRRDNLMSRILPKGRKSPVA